LIIGFLDFLINGQKLKIYHMIGVASLVISACSISLAQLGEDEEVRQSVVPAWIPVLYAILTPVMFSIQGLFIKHLTTPKMGFDASCITFGASSFVCTIIMIVGVSWYWQNYKFDSYLFCVGLIGSIFDTVGIVSIQNAFSKGPAGLVAALGSCTALILVVMQAIKMWEVPRNMEIVGFCIGVLGALIIVIPD